MNAVISVVGKDKVGILAGVSTKCAEFNANINDVSQTIVNNFFTMYMIVSIDSLTIEFTKFGDELKAFGREMGLEINVMHEDIFNLMHKI